MAMAYLLRGLSRKLWGRGPARRPPIDPFQRIDAGVAEIKTIIDNRLQSYRGSPASPIHL
jgi:hypothetical protein